MTIKQLWLAMMLVVLAMAASRPETLFSVSLGVAETLTLGLSLLQEVLGELAGR